MDRSANDHNDATNEDRLFASEHVTEPDSRDSTKEATESVSTHGDRLDGGSVACIAIWWVQSVDLRKVVYERRQGEQAAHHTLVCTWIERLQYCEIE